MPLTAFGGVIQDPTEPWCLDRDASADIKQLKCLQGMEEAQALKSEIREFVRQKKACPKCKSSVIDDGKSLALIGYPYMVIAITLTRMSTGMDVHVIFKKQPLQEYRIWLDYETEIYKLGAISARSRTREMTKLLKRLQDKQYNEFWVKN